MSSSDYQSHDQAPPPPPPAPPLPPPSAPNALANIVLKTRGAAPGWSQNQPDHVDYLEPQTGPYFFYGTLVDPKMLAEILALDGEPALRPAQVVGYTCKLWGQYPAVVDGEEAGEVVSGAAYHVERVEDARRLAVYETRNYRTKVCEIMYTDGKQPEMQRGRLFVFAGSLQDLEEVETD